MGGEEERGALYPHMTPLRLVDGVRPWGAGLDDIIQVVGVHPDLQDRHLGVVLHDPPQPVGEGAGLLVGGEEGAGEADASNLNGGARGDHHLGVGVSGEVGAAQPIWAESGPAEPREPTAARVALVWSTKWANKGIGAEMQGNKVKDRCCMESLLEPLLKPLVEPPFCAGTPAGTLAGTPLSALEPLLEPTFVRFWSFLGIRHSVWPFTT